MRNLRSDEIVQLAAQGCIATDWNDIKVSDAFEIAKIRNVSFCGKVEIGNNVTLCNIRVGIGGYKIGNGARIIDCGSIISESDSTFGIGHEVCVVNEAGGREVKLSQDLTNNIAYMVAMHRYNKAMVESYNRLVEKEAKAFKGKAVIAEGAQIIGCQTIHNVRIGQGARLNGCSLLENGTILSFNVLPAIIGSNVIMHDFIVAEGAQITDAAIIKSSYIGQCSLVGSGFMADNCLVFANCQLFCGEGVAAFCGPYTVSHHKTSLLIAAMYSFFNAGSATNASNHHYRLGPNHQAIFDRGVKTGSGSYVLEPAHIGAYTMVVGSHKSNPDTSDFPFSYLIEKQGESYLLPAQNLKTMGLFRDEVKWHRRDLRIESIARDLFTTEVFNPLTIGKMIKAVNKADEMIASATGDTILVNGVRIQKGLLVRARNAYNEVAQAFVLESYLKSQEYEGAPTEWTDCGGLIVPKDQMEALESNLAQGLYHSVADIAKAFDALALYYESDVSTWCAKMVRENYGISGEPDKEEAEKVISGYTSLMNGMLADAQKDFNRKMAVGYGLDSNDNQAMHEYTVVKGTFDTNKSVEICRKYFSKHMRLANKILGGQQ